MVVSERSDAIATYYNIVKHYENKVVNVVISTSTSLTFYALTFYVRTFKGEPEMRSSEESNAVPLF